MRRLDRIFVCLYLAIAVLPVTAMVRKIKDHPLDGVFPPAPRPAITYQGVRSEDYQKGVTTWFEQSLGLRAWAVWVDNTILYHVFGETKFGAATQIGHDDMLFERDDVGFFNKSGDQLPDPKEVDKLADDIAALQQRLRADHKALVPVFVPSKTTFYRDAVPALWTRDLGDPRPSTVRVYQAMKQALDRRGVTYVDGIEMLATSKEPRDLLWGKQARHFSNYAGCLCVREELAVYAQLTGTAPIDYPCQPHLHRASRTHSDLDLFRLLNAWWIPRDRVGRDVNHDPLPDQPPPQAPRTLWISSSFGWVMMGDAELSKRIRDPRIDYYNQSVHGAGDSFEVHPGDDNWNRVFLDQDLYVLELNESYLTPGNFFGADAIRAVSAALKTASRE
jgi:hypothetical protein